MNESVQVKCRLSLVITEKESRKNSRGSKGTTSSRVS